jgi:hypothetical protein
MTAESSSRRGSMCQMVGKSVGVALGKIIIFMGKVD